MIQPIHRRTPVSRGLDGTVGASLLGEAARALRATLSAPPNDALRMAFLAWCTPPPTGHFILGPGRLVPSWGDADLGAAFVVWDSAEPEGSRWPYQAYLAHRTDAGWSVNWVLAQCASCFGVGLTEDSGTEICGTCGGSGWGVLGSREHAYVPEFVAAS